MIAFYHSADLDGKCSAAIIQSVFPTIELIPLDYGDDYDAKIFSRNFTNKTIYFLDVTLQPRSLMLELEKNGNQVVVIDHHIGALKDFDTLGWKPDGVLDTSKAACWLTWEYFYPNTSVPIAVKYLSCWDIWDHSDIHTELFQYGMRYMDLDVDSAEWEILLSNDNGCELLIADIIATGGVVKFWNMIKNKKIASMSAREVMFDGWRSVVINGYDGSPLFSSVYDETKHDLMISYIQRSDSRWQWGFYSDKPNVDCDLIAKKYGGGGHFSASGATTEHMIF